MLRVFITSIVGDDDLVVSILGAESCDAPQRLVLCNQIHSVLVEVLTAWVLVLVSLPSDCLVSLHKSRSEECYLVFLFYYLYYYCFVCGT